MEMTLAEELRRRIEILEHHHNGIGSEVAVVKAEVGTMQRDINYLRTSTEAMGSKLDTVLTNITALNAQTTMLRPRDPFDVAKASMSVIVGVFVLIGMAVGAVKFISATNDTSDIAKALSNIEQRLSSSSPDKTR